MIWSIIEATGWSYQYVLDGITWINIRMMLADQRKYGKVNKKQTDEEYLDDFCNE